MTDSEKQSDVLETERFEIHLWDIAPDHWLTPDDRKEHSLESAELVGEPGDERVVFEMERREPTEEPR